MDLSKEKPKLHESYWYIDTDGEQWEILQKENCMEDMDKYNFAQKNFFPTREALLEDAFDVLMRLTLQDAETVGHMIVDARKRGM